MMETFQGRISLTNVCDCGLQNRKLIPLMRKFLSSYHGHQESSLYSVFHSGSLRLKEFVRLFYQSRSVKSRKFSVW